MRRLAGMGVIRRVQNHDDEGEGDEDRGGEDESAHARSITEYDGEILASDGPRAARGGRSGQRGGVRQKNWSARKWPQFQGKSVRNWGLSGSCRRMVHRCFSHGTAR